MAEIPAKPGAKPGKSLRGAQHNGKRLEVKLSG
jgi:hypothetical protein